MALYSDAAMVLFYDIDGDPADHDDWHSHEHFHERLSVPGFQRATRWIATRGTPRCMVIYEVSGTDVATSQGYLDRLNDPTEWTNAIMPRFRGMTRGFCTMVASEGFGFGAAAASLRFTPEEGHEAGLSEWLARDVLPAMASRRGMTGAYLMQPSAPPPMTREQALRGRDKVTPWLVIATGYDAAALDRAVAEHLDLDTVRARGAAADLSLDLYALHYTATAKEAERTPKPAVLTPEQWRSAGPRL